MARAFLVVMDSVGIGGAPDADRYFNGDVPDTGANTLGHIAQACSAGKAEDGRSGPLHVPNLASLGLFQAVALASGLDLPGPDAQRHMGCGNRSVARQGYAFRPLGTGRFTGAMGLALFPRHREFVPRYRDRRGDAACWNRWYLGQLPRARDRDH